MHANMAVVGIGIDIELIERFENNAEEKSNKLLNRLFSQQEIESCLTRKYPAQHFAARYCAKEAFVKASSCIDDFLITDVEIVKKEKQPFLQMKGDKPSLQKLFAQYDVLLSMSHCQRYACAQVLIQNKQTNKN